MNCSELHRGWTWIVLLALSLPAGLLQAAGPQRLTTDGKLKSAPVFASSQEIVFAVHEVPNLVALKRLKLKDGTQELMHSTLKAHQFDPTFSPDRRYHCFALSATSPQLVLV